jgi:plastocyanin
MRLIGKIRGIRFAAGMALACLCCCVILSQTIPSPVVVQVQIVSPEGGKKSTPVKERSDASDVVIWLLPVADSSGHTPATQAAGPQPQIVQYNKSFEPHVSVVQVGKFVQFPNRDPFLHNVFSLFDGKRFDLGFYEAGSSKTVHFDRPGVSFLFCNIHPEMSAAVVAVDTPYFGKSDKSGRVSIANVPEGKYQLNVWYERSLPDALKAAGRTVTISDATRTIDPVRVVENPNFSPEHKNKYGQEYVPPPDSSPVYGHP